MVNQSAFIFTLELLVYAQTLSEYSSEIEESFSSDVSSVTNTSVSAVNSIHTQVLLSSKKQIRLI